MMRSVILLPYCPLPIDTGAKSEIWKHLNVLKALGSCRILSAIRKPVGGGWTHEKRAEMESYGFSVSFREDFQPRRSWCQWGGIAYAAGAKLMGMEKAFGHSNPYHRYAFPADWWYRLTSDADLAVIFYSYWSYLPSACPKAVVLLDLWSEFMWEGPKREIRDLKTSDLVIVISKEEQRKLQSSGVTRIFWNPPAIPAVACPDSQEIGLLGSASSVNCEGLRWLESAMTPGLPPIRVYGGLSDLVEGSGFINMGRYDLSEEPYQQCGIIIMTTALGMGVQIKSIEALACGRAIVARKEAMRGLPLDKKAWIEVESPEEMLDWAQRLVADKGLRAEWSSRARAYYEKHLDSEKILADLREKYYLMAVTSV
jgi:hypothetical protein